MFWFLLPGAVFLTELICLPLFSSQAGYDTGDVTSMFCPGVTLLPVLFGVVFPIMELIRPNGNRALLQVLPLLAVVVIVPPIVVFFKIDMSANGHH